MTVVPVGAKLDEAIWVNDVAYCLSDDGTAQVVGFNFPVEGAEITLTVPDKISVDDALYPVHAILCQVLRKGPRPKGQDLDDNTMEQRRELVLEDSSFHAYIDLRAVTFTPQIYIDPLLGFQGCGIELLVVPDSVHTIGPNCLCACFWLQSIQFRPISQLQSVVSSICDCDRLVDLQFPPALHILAHSVVRCPKLPAVLFAEPSELQTIRESICDCDSLENLQFPPSLELLTDSIVGCPKLVTLSFAEPSRLSTVTGSIHDCKGLVTLAFPPSLELLTDSIVGCRRLRRVSFATQSSLRSITKSICDCPLLFQLTCPASVREIGSSVNDCDWLNVLSFATPSELQLIEASFCRCKALRALTVQPSVIVIRDSFCDCSGLQNVNFGGPHKLKVLCGFSGTPLHNITIPGSVEVLEVLSCKPIDQDRRSHACVLNFGHPSALETTAVSRPLGFVRYPASTLRRCRRFLEWMELMPASSGRTKVQFAGVVPHLPQVDLGPIPVDMHPAPRDQPATDGNQSDPDVSQSAPDVDESDGDGLPPDDDELPLDADISLPSGDEWEDRVLLDDAIEAAMNEDVPESIDLPDIDHTARPFNRPSLLPVEPETPREDPVLTNVSEPEMIDDVLEELLPSSHMTPLEIISAIRALHGQPLTFLITNGCVTESGSPSLTRYVRENSRIALGCPLFRAVNTGSSRCTQVYGCANDPDCTAGFEIKMYKGCMLLGKHEFHHTHEFFFRLTGAYHTLPDTIRDEVRRMTAANASPGQIRSALDLSASGSVFYGARRDVLKALREHQAQSLADAVAHWPGWHVLMVPPPKGSNEFHGFLATHTRVIEHPMCCDTLSMDDTGCTNFFDLPVSAIVAPDGNDATQLVAFAILRDQSAEALIEFLKFLRQDMGDKSPKAFMIDRAPAEIRAIMVVFPEAHVCHCLIHIFRNIQLKCGKVAELAMAFWPAMRGTPEDQQSYRDLLLAAYMTYHRAHKTEAANCVAGLWNVWQNWAPCETSKYTDIQTTGMNEGLNGNVKKFLDRKRVTLPYLANAWRHLGEIAFVRSQQMRTRFIAQCLMSRQDQRYVGRFGLAILVSQVNVWLKPELWTPLKGKSYTGNCCHIHRLYPGFPCAHRVRDLCKERGWCKAALADRLRYDRPCDEPFFSRAEIPQRWLRILYACPYRRASQARVKRPLPAPVAFDRKAVREAFEAAMAIAETSEEMRRMMVAFVRAWGERRPDSAPESGGDGERPPDAAPESGGDDPVVEFTDPPQKHGPGAWFVSPAGRSPLGFLKGG
jgi:hypothetical protein